MFSNLDERLDHYRILHNELADGLPVDTAFVSSKALEGLPNAGILSEIEGVLGMLPGKLEALGDQSGKAIAEADRANAETKSRWSAHKTAIEGTCEDLLRELRKSKIDGAEFIRLRQQIESLCPLHDRMERHRRDLEAHEAQRRNLLAEWEDIKAAEYRLVGTASKRVSRKLRDRVQVRVTMAGNRDPLERLLREVGGNLAAALERLRTHDQLSLRELAQRCREGKEALRTHYRLPSGAAERIAQADPELMRIEELELPATTEIELNTAPDGAPTNWQTLQALSTSQKATAVLLLLLLEPDAPLVVDQPEDDLDNSFITEGVVPIMRQSKFAAASSTSRHTTPTSRSSATPNSSLASLRRARSGKARRGSRRSIWLPSTQDLCANWSRKSSKAARPHSRCVAPSTSSEA